MKLTRDNFDRARAYLMQHGRPMEQALFRWCFEDGSASDAFSVLKTHQAPNGGFFGMGEGPVTVPSPAGSAVAFEYLTDLGIPGQQSLVQSGIRYFIDTYDHQHAVWPPQIPDDDYLSNDLPRYWGNPSAAIVGFLWCYHELVPSGFLAKVTDVAMANFRQIGHDLPGFADLCFLRCADFIPQPYRDEIIHALAGGIARRNVQCDHAQWDLGYFIKPYWYARNPAAPLRSVLEDEIERCLDFDIRTQEADGSARLTFHVERESRRIWKSMWTLESLRLLKAYGRIEGQ